jgi:hypothetical protein
LLDDGFGHAKDTTREAGGQQGRGHFGGADENAKLRLPFGASIRGGMGHEQWHDKTYFLGMGAPLKLATEPDFLRAKTFKLVFRA